LIQVNDFAGHSLYRRHMMRFLLVATCLFILTGCAQQQFAERKAAYDAAVAQCAVTTSARVGNYVPRARCVNAASEQFSPPSDTAAPLIRATRLSLAAKLDRRELSPEDAGAELARVIFEARQEQARTGAAVAAGHGAALAGSAAMLNATMPHQTNCWAAGPSLSCTGY
jgi:hypothetical protein